MTDKTLSLIIPYFKDLPPQLLLPAIPPIVALLEVETSTGNHNPYCLRYLFNSSKTIPGSTVQVLFLLSNSKILLKYLELSITSDLLTVWPHWDVPPPLGKIEILFSKQKFTAFKTSSLSFGIKTPKGSIWYIEASVEYLPFENSSS